MDTLPTNPLKPAARLSRQPVLFIGHGNPMHAIDKNPFRHEWARLGQVLQAHYPPPRAVLAISAHWVTHGTYLTSSQQPRTIHDFYGFPPALFAQQYPAPGAPDIAQEIVTHLHKHGVPAQADGGAWGLDHGSWAVLLSLIPAAHIPTLQLSLNADAQNLAAHYAIGRALRNLRDKGILILGSGNTVHNFALMRAPADSALWHDAFAFDARIAQSVAQHQHDALMVFDDNHSSTLLKAAHPTLEHYLPLLYAAGASYPDEPCQQFLEQNHAQAPVGMRCIQWG